MIVLNLLLAIGGIFLLGVGLALPIHVGAKVLVAALGVLLLWIGFTSDGRRVKVAEDQRLQSIGAARNKLLKGAWRSDQTLVVPGATGLTTVLLLLVAAAGAFGLNEGYERKAATWIAGSGLVLFAVAFALSRTLAGWGKPALILSAKGWQTPIYGMLPWSAVDGINLFQVTSRGGAKSSSLLFFVPDIASVANRAHWSDRLLAVFGLGVLRRNQIGVSLRRDPELEPETVESVARHLWQQATGKDHYWSPMLSRRHNEASKRMNEFVAASKDHLAAMPSPEELEKDPEAALRRLEKLAERTSQFNADLNTTRSEQRRTIRHLNWAIVITGGVTLLVLLWPVVRRILH